MAILLPTATFLHIPKCGGSWAVRAMSAAGIPLSVEPPDGQHAVAATEGRFVFTFVRYPLTWYASFWNFRWNAAGGHGKPLEAILQDDARRCDEPIDECLVDECGRPRPFADFVEQCLSRHPGFLSRKYALYTPKAHFIGRQESLCQDLLAALRQAKAVFDADIIRQMPKVNVASPQYRTSYPPALARRLLDTEAAAVREFYADARAHGLLSA